MTPSDETKLDVLSKHYENTFQLVMTVIKRRDRSLGFIIIVVALFWLQVIAPDEVGEAASQVAQDRLGLSNSPSMLLVGSLLWCLLLGLCVRYFQAVDHAERLYTYIHGLENVLSKQFEAPAFTREGSSYLNDYPIYRSWVGFLYSVAIPSFLILSIAIKIIVEFQVNGFAWITVFNFAAFISILISILLHIWSRSKRAQNETEAG